MVLGVGLLVAAAGRGGGDAEAPSAPQPPARPVPRAALAVEHRPRPHGAGRARRVAVPRRLVIPSIHLSTGLVRLGLDAHGALEVPRAFDVAGWYVRGPRPGENGPAVIAGHVDSTAGPAVFFRLGSLRRGDVVRVIGSDHRTVEFRVEAVHRAAKDRFPTKRVYGPTRRPALRLVTCGGSFDTASGHYRDNTIVYASER